MLAFLFVGERLQPSEPGAALNDAKPFSGDERNFPDGNSNVIADCEQTGHNKVPDQNMADTKSRKEDLCRKRKSKKKRPRKRAP